MKILLWFVLVTLSALTQTSCDETTSRKKLQIGVKKRVDNCTLRSKRGDTLVVNYVGTLEDGTEFDSSSNYDDSFFITLGYGQVIKGWEQGLIGMCVGEKRKLVIPPDLAYGSFGALPKIPPNATVIFTVELVKLVSKEEPRQSDTQFHEEL
ncbi:peptidyl-prolyl cis-trans isomerase FKBP2 [Copidosoma floridanum]|uniref:peptidyl-prolyl cis-trans isomerase FKBP2 n=1 Tax=Copidosoma floridanum TaxID=29053 RepID=UPI0006C9CB11|nr:peptidyl-prolyl cis-trans isomerase FKBP2 [Copidosoma floridanum]